MTSVVVGDAGCLVTTRQMAWSLAPRLTGHYTPLRDGQFGRLERLPPLRSIAARRRLPGPVASAARTLWSPAELVRIGLGRVGGQRFAYELIWRRNRGFDAALARRIEPGSLLVGQYGACLTSLRETHAQGGRVVLDHPIGEQWTGVEMLEEEAARRPEFADTLSGLSRRRENERITLEALEADLVVVGSEFAARTFRDRLPSARVAVASYGTDTSRFSPRTDGARERGPLRVLFAGQLTARKGLGYLLDAFDLLDPSRFDLTLVGPVVGEGAWYPRYERLFRHVHGLTVDQMPDVYRNADVLVLPSLYEGSAVVVLESLASGVPVIVTENVGADAVTDGREGFVVPIRDPASIAERLERLASDRALLATMSEHARRRAASGLDWADFRRRFRTVLDAEGLLDASDVPPERVAEVVGT